MLGTDGRSIDMAVSLLKSGETVAIPTETVYGLAAVASDENAVRKIFEAKGRPADNPLIVHISDLSMLEAIVSEIPPLAAECARLFWPGPLTMVMPKSDAIPYVTSGGLETVGIRFPSNELAREIISRCKAGLAAPSANLSGSPSPTCAQHVMKDMRGRIPAIVDGGSCSVGVESTVISFEDDGVRLLRPGGVSVEMLREAVGRVIIDKGVSHMLSPDAKAASPGMKYRHYSPDAEVFILRGTSERIAGYLEANSQEGDFALLFGIDAINCKAHMLDFGSTPEQQANRLFDLLRKCDELGAKRVFARCPETGGVGLAVYNRLLRAAAFRVIDV